MSMGAFVATARRMVCAGVAATVLLSLAGCGSLVLVSSDTPVCTSPGPTSRSDPFNANVPLTTTRTGLKYGDISVGCGAQPRAGQTVMLQYTGWLTNGRLFDSSRRAGRSPIAFRVGEGLIIPGLEQGVASMRVGGTRRLVIPPELAFGPNVRAGIPGNSTLLMTVELVSISG